MPDGDAEQPRRETVLSRATIKDVAIAAGVSVATVSNVLNRRRSVAPELVDRVRKAIADLDFQTNRVASSLRRRQTSVVGLVVPSLMSPFFAQLTTCLERLAHAQGYQLVVASTDEEPEQERERVLTMLAWRAAGIILVPTNERFASREVITSQHVKAVILDRVPEAHDLDSVAVNNAEATAEATRRLIELGHTTILAVASSRSVPNMLERIVAFETVAAGAGLTRGCAVICYGGSGDVVRYGDELASITETVAARLCERPRPTAIFALNNIATLTALKALGRLGLRIPEDVSLLGFDDYEWMQAYRPPISAVRQPVEELARHAWERLLQRLRGDVVPRAEVRLACSMEWRGSTKPLASHTGS